LNCSGDDSPGGGSDNPGNNKIDPGEQVLQSFESRYHNASQLVWSKEAGYLVADFKLDARSASAWFTAQGEWALEKLSTPYGQIEPVVAGAFLRTTYATWEMKEAYILDRKGLTPVYGLSVTNKSIFSNLYFTLYGDLIKVIDDVHDRTDMPVTMPQVLLNTLDKLFKEPEIVDVSVVDLINSEVSVGVIEELLFKTAIFDRHYQWIVNFWDLTPQTVPEAVWSGFTNSTYSKLKLLRMRAMHTSTGTTFLFYLDNGGKTIIAEFNEKGQLTTIISRNHPMAKYLLMR
jgi:hypothetical protein